MSDANVELVRRACEAYARGELETSIETLDRDVEYGRGRRSGIEVEQTLDHLWTVRHGRVVAMKVYLARDAAFAAAGLSG